MRLRHQHRRTHYLINKKIQLKYALLILGILIIVSLASSVGFYYGIWGSVLQEFSQQSIKNRLTLATQLNNYQDARKGRYSKELNHLALIEEVELFSQREQEILREILTQNNREILLKGLLLFLIIAFGTIFLTHKIAGPLYRIMNIFDQIKDGNLTVRIRLRKQDEAQELTEHLNAMIATLDYSFMTVKRDIAAIQTLHLSNRPRAEDIAVTLESVKRELDRYKTSNA